MNCFNKDTYPASDHQGPRVSQVLDGAKNVQFFFCLEPIYEVRQGTVNSGTTSTIAEEVQNELIKKTYALRLIFLEAQTEQNNL